jgi:hypothetical protein
MLGNNSPNKDIEFNNWTKELEDRFLSFQVQQHLRTEIEYWLHRNCVKYDYEIHRLRKFNNPCKGCGLPLALTHNFEVPEYGHVCGACYAMYTAITQSKHFYDLHMAWVREGKKRER